jgi:hypothetical protein
MRMKTLSDVYSTRRQADLQVTDVTNKLGSADSETPGSLTGQGQTTSRQRLFIFSYVKFNDRI